MIPRSLLLGQWGQFMFSAGGRDDSAKSRIARVSAVRLQDDSRSMLIHYPGVQMGSRGSPLLRSQTPLLVFLTPSLASTSSLATVHPCRSYLAIANLSLPKGSFSASHASRHASSAASAARQPSPDGNNAASRPQPLLRPRPARSPEELKNRQSTLLDRIRNNLSKPRDGLGSKEDRDRQVDSLLGISDNSTRDEAESTSGDRKNTASWTEPTIEEERAARRRKEYELAQREQEGQSDRQGRIARGMQMPPRDNARIQEQPAMEVAEATRAVATIKSRPSLGRTIQVLPDRGMDVGRAMRTLAINCKLNNVRRDAARQRYYERPGLKRKRVKRERWRRRFKIGFKAIVAKVKSMRRKGW